MPVSYRDAATALWGDAGNYAHDAYARLRPLLPELPPELPIVIGITAYGRCLGLTRTDWSAGPRITIASNLFAQGRLGVDDTMIHEMLHAWLRVTRRNTAHESADWYAAVRRLSPAVLGVELPVERGLRRSVRVTNPRADEPDQPATVVRKLPAEQVIPHADVARWPHPFRPDGYDWGAPIDCPVY